MAEFVRQAMTLYTEGNKAAPSGSDIWLFRDVEFELCVITAAGHGRENLPKNWEPSEGLPS